MFFTESPSPRVELKFRSQFQDKVHGNDCVYKSFGSNAERCHRHFKAFLACQDPRIESPPRDNHPNWKVRPLLSWMNFIFPTIWLLACAFSVDEMTMGFKGQHRDGKTYHLQTRRGRLSGRCLMSRRLHLPDLDAE